MNAHDIIISPWADLMVTTQEIYDESPLTREMITDKYYQLVITEDNILIFQKDSTFH